MDCNYKVHISGQDAMLPQMSTPVIPIKDEEVEGNMDLPEELPLDIDLEDFLFLEKLDSPGVDENSPTLFNESEEEVSQNTSFAASDLLEIKVELPENFESQDLCCFIEPRTFGFVEKSSIVSFSLSLNDSEEGKHKNTLSSFDECGEVNDQIPRVSSDAVKRGKRKQDLTPKCLKRKRSSGEKPLYLRGRDEVDPDCWKQVVRARNTKLFHERRLKKIRDAEELLSVLLQRKYNWDLLKRAGLLPNLEESFPALMKH